jgi:hypothetical protein
LRKWVHNWTFWMFFVHARRRSCRLKLAGGRHIIRRSCWGFITPLLLLLLL